MVKVSDKRLIECKQQENLAFQLLFQAQSLDEKDKCEITYVISTNSSAS